MKVSLHFEREMLTFSDLTFDDLPKEGIEWEKRNKRIVKMIEKTKRAREELLKGEFDALIMAIENNPLEIMKELLPFVGGSCPVVIYNPYKEVNLWILSDHL